MAFPSRQFSRPPIELPSLAKAQHRAAVMRAFMDLPAYKVLAEILDECLADQIAQLVTCPPETTGRHQAAYQAYHFCRYLPEYVMDDEKRIREEHAIARKAAREETLA